MPFEGNLTFSVYGLAENSGNRTSGLIESIRARIPVLLNNEDETIEVAWNERLPEGVYRLEIELLGNDGDIIERRETIIESDLSAVSNVSQINDTDNGAVTPGENDEDGIPGFSSVAGIIGLILVSVFLRKTRR